MHGEEEERERGRERENLIWLKTSRTITDVERGRD